MSWRRSVVFSLVLFVLTILSGCGGSSKPISVTVTASPTTVDGTNTATLTATVANDKNAAGVNWSVSGGGTLSNSTTSTATYTAPAATSSAQTVTITATSIADTAKTGTATITVPAAPSITTTSLSAGAVGTAYSVSLAASGGISPYTWTITSGSLPTGLSMTTGGVISGTPTAASVGTATATFKVTDSGSPNALTATASLTLTIQPAPTITFPSATLTGATYHASYSATVAATGGAGTLTYSITAGALPTGLSMSTAGAITGTPAVTGTFGFTVTAADAYGDSASQAFSLAVTYPQLTITQPTLANGYVGSAYVSTTLVATGGSGTGYTWALASGSSLPAGLVLSTGGVISGTPTATGTTAFTVQVTDSASNTATLALSITVKPAISITTTSPLVVGYKGSAYSKTLVATGGSGTGYTWTVNSGSTLPAGLSLSSAGVLNGTPTATGTTSFAVTVTDSASNTASATFSLTISPGITITTSSPLPWAYQGSAYTPVTFAATGGDGGPYTWSWAATSGSLPAGLSLSSAGVLSGTPTAAGTFNLAVTATDAASNTTSVTFALTVEATLAVSSTTLKSGTVNVAYSQALTATGGSGSGYTWTVTAGASSLATLNLSLSSAGTLSGTPTTTGTASFTVQVADTQSHTATANLSVSIYNVLTITTTTLPATDAGVAYSQTLNAGGGTGSGYTWATTGSSNLSSFGLTLSSAGVISGTPSSSGTATFTAQVTDSGNSTATQALTITIYNALVLPTPNPSTLGAGVTGGTYSGTVVASGGSGSYGWTVSGFPQDGLNYSTSGATLTVSGTPTAATTVSFTASVKDTATNQSVGPNTYTITVSNPTPLTLPSTNPSSLPSATINNSYSGTIAASGGVPPYTWTVNTVSVPTNGTPVTLSNGLSASNNGSTTLTVSGTPTSTGTVTISAQIADSASHTAGPTSYTVAINAAGSQVSGHVALANTCGSVTMPTFQVSINTSPVQTVSTDSNGNYSFGSVPNGTYTITPSISGPSATFMPATITGVVVNNATVNSQNFQASVGYTVSGTVSYSGTKTGQVYVVLSNTNCSFTSFGTSISAAGSYTIRGVGPGTYSLSAAMDTLSSGGQNSSNPSGAAGSNITVSNANITGANVSIADPTVTAPTAGPKLHGVSPTATGVAISFKPVTTVSGGNIEAVTSYTVQWSTDTAFSSPSSFTLAADGTGGANVWILNDSTSGIVGNFDHGPYYFRVRGTNSAGSSPWTYWGTSSSPTPVTIAAPSTGNAITGAVTFSGTPTGPLYVGFYDQNTGSIYATRLATPSSPAAFSVMVPTGSNYYFFGIMDQDNNGIVNAGDITNVHSENASVAVSASTVMNLTLPSSSSTAKVTTQHYNQTNQSSTNIGYSLQFEIREGNKLPVSATITSGPNVHNPIDLGVCTTCGTPQFDYSSSLGAVAPAVGDSYAVKVTYSDGTNETLNAAVTAVLNAFATNLTTGGSSRTQPSFSWTDPSNASNYVYEFFLQDSNRNYLWQVPSSDSNLTGFSSSITSLAWGVDPNDNTNIPTVSNLTTGSTYYWQITVQDTDGNQAQTQVYYIP